MDDPLAPGQLLRERFRVVRRIAQGGMGVVYEARDEKLDRPIALKCARVGHDRRLLPEVRLATEVSHPNICKIYEIHAVESPNGPVEFFTMELLEGPTLSRRLRDGPLPLHDAEIIARHLCAGLAEAHKHKIIHGDLKAGNVILAKNPDGTLRAVITDFGLAHGKSVLGATGGTPGYMAPELSGGAATTVASDIYALGVILHQLVSGVRPDERAAQLASTLTLNSAEPAVPLDRLQQRAELSRMPLPPLRSRWDKVITTCLQADPSQRYPTVDHLLEALRPSSTRRRILVAAGVVALAGTAALGTYRLSTAPPQSVTLDFPTVQADAALAAEAAQLGQEGLRALGQLTNSKQIAFSVRSSTWGSKPSHRLSADLSSKGKKIVVHTVLSELQSGAPMIEWSASYEPRQLRYAPVALAGVVSRAFHLPALTASATVNQAAAASYNDGLALFRDDKLDQALVAFQTAAQLDSDSALPYAALTEVQRRKSFLTRDTSWQEQALASFEQAELRNTDFAEAHRIAGLLEYDRNRPDQAIARMIRATEFEPPHPDAFRRLGALYYQGGQLPEALQAYSEARRLAPGDVRVYQDLANLYTSQSNFVEASRALQRAVEIAPDRAPLRRLLGASHQGEGRFAEAETELRSALRQENSADTLRELGIVFLYQKREKEAIEVLNQAAGLNPIDMSTWLFLALGYQALGRIPEASKAFHRGFVLAEKEVIELPRSGYYHAMLAYLCAQSGQADRASVEAAQAMQLAPRHGGTLRMTALTYERIGNRKTALKTLEAAPLPLLEDLERWPEAAALTQDQSFAAVLRAAAQRR